MSTSISKTDIKKKEELVTKLRKAESELEDAVNTYNATMNEAKETVNQAVTAYNETLEEARTFVEDTKNSLQEKFDNKSETWQQSDAGSAMAEFINSWESIELEDVPDFEVEELEFGVDHAEGLEGAPEEE